MTTIIVASANPVKIRAALGGFQRMWPEQTFVADGVSIPSGVSDQPMGDDETLRGAYQRAAGAREARPNASYWVGIEGGCAEGAGGMETFAWVVVLGHATSGHSRTGMFMLPDEVAELVRGGMELGHADDAVFGRSNSKQEDGSVGLMTGGVIDRAAYYEHAVVLALIPFRQPQLHFPAAF
ncbi:MAG: inosine/xanthosine triphosphatase [Anaerolineae bacterium]|nr:inosine/xanthosine triphosphatase [Anaerolineae bacterium]